MGLHWAKDNPHLAIVALLLAILSSFTVGAYYFLHEARKQVAMDTARTFLESIIGMHQYYSSEIVPIVESSGARFSLAYNDEVGVFPYPATVSSNFSDYLSHVNENLRTSLYSTSPFPNKTDRMLDTFEHESLSLFRTGEAEEFFSFELVNDVEVIRLARAMVMRQDCINCHNRPEFGFEGAWQVGDFRGARQVTIPVPNMTPIINEAVTYAVVMAVVASALAGALAFPLVLRTRRYAADMAGLASDLDRKNTDLNAAMESRQRLFSGISHDLKSRLNAVSGFSQLTEQMLPERPEKAQEYARDASDASNQMLSLIDQILENAKIGTGAWEPRDERFMIGELINGLETSLRHTLAVRDIALKTELAEPDIEITADRTALQRVLTNLTDNAAKYSGGTTATIQTQRLSDGRCSLTFFDDGRGAKQSDFERIRSYSAKAELAETQDGAGLGLWIIDTLMAAHDAEVTISNSEESGGLHIRIVFPRERVQT